MRIFCLVFALLYSVIFWSQNNKKPNILWIVCEGISPTLPFYGDFTAKTPNLDNLAEESMVYSNAFTTVGDCAPSRSGIITGMYPTSIGTMHMRTANDIQSWGNRIYKDSIPSLDVSNKHIREYSVVIPYYVKCFSEHLRAKGYYCTNNQKTDYQFSAPLSAWDENNKNAHWRNRPEGTPFFSVFNFNETHESMLWKNEKLPLTVSPKNVFVPPYLPDNSSTRNTIARHYSNIELLDKRIGELITQLKKNNIYDNTIIFLYSDHGGPLPRQKREIYDSGLRVPFLIKSVNSNEKGKIDRLISLIDLAPTVLSLAGISPPSYIQGKAFLGQYAAKKRTYVFGSSDRFNEYTDRIRSVRDKEFLYIRNFFPDRPKYKDLAYRKQIPMMEDFLKLKAKEKLSNIQNSWFQTKAVEELYDSKKDPHNLNNLVNNPNYKQTLDKLRLVYLKHTYSTSDLGQLPESQLIDIMWPGGVQPVTKVADIKFKNDVAKLFSKTLGASISYYISNKPNEKLDFNSGWKLYTKPLHVQKGKYIYTIAERIGFKKSEIQVEIP